LALAYCKIKTSTSLTEFLSSPEFESVERIYCSLELIPYAELSHLAICMLVIGKRNKALLATFFPEYWDDVTLRTAVL
jgi:hypothetical protein